MTGLTSSVPKFNPDFLEKIISDVPPVDYFLGKPLFLLLFNFGCPGCIHRALPFMNTLFRDHSAKINFIGIHTNHEGVDFADQDIEKFISTQQIDFPIFRDKNYNDFYYNYEAAGTPHWYIFNNILELKYNMFGSDPNRGLLKLTYILEEILKTET